MSDAVRIVRRVTQPPTGTWPDDVPALLRRLYAARGAHSLELARPGLSGLPHPALLSGIDGATGLLADAIGEGRHIQVVGDFDCDGATACAVAVRGLRMLGAGHVSHAVANRMIHGYGLSPALVADLAAEPCAGASGGARLLVTVDHGVACHAGVAAARARGWQVLVTDHHLPGEQVAAADALVNPNCRGDRFPGKSLAGVGVVFYVLLALRARLVGEGRLPGEALDLSTLLDLVAVGTVADLVPLDAVNRALVRGGLRRIRAGRAGAGLRALIAAAGRDPARLDAGDIAFAVAPRINAAGRLEDMSLGIECLLSDDEPRARDLASRLDAINAQRRGVQGVMVDEAERLVQAARETCIAPRAGICVFDPTWHPGVIGLVASKLKESMHRPVVAFAPAEPGSDQLRGSARSIPGFHIRDALAAVAAAQPGLIDKFGGHAMAAGLTLARKALPEFEAAFVALADSALDAATLRAEVTSDGALLDGEFDRHHADALRDGGPWGQGFPEPVFDGTFDVVSWRPVGTRHLKLELAHAGGRLNAIHFGGWTGSPPAGRLHLAFRLTPDDYRGGEAVQLVVVHSAPA